MELPTETREKLIWLFLLAPGFISVTIVGLLVDVGELSEFQITYYSLVLTILNLTIAIALLWIVGLFRKAKAPWSSGTLLLWSLVISVVIGTVLGLLAEKDALFVTLRSLPITKELNKRSSTRPTILLLSQNSGGRLNKEGDGRPKDLKVTEAWALVTLKEGDRRYEGWPEFYGLGKDSALEIYLSPACEIVTKAGKEKLQKIPGPGVIVYEDQIRSISLIDRACSPCFLRWNPQKLTKEDAARCRS
jgi:hypothetical protein